ncbi:sulfate anion transporter [Ceratobasidium sp. AG-Ba]|nr:sulfate anion transporter [Ceratobasidium sp. AG-Ba]
MSLRRSSIPNSLMSSYSRTRGFLHPNMAMTAANAEAVEDDDDPGPQSFGAGASSGPASILVRRGSFTHTYSSPSHSHSARMSDTPDRIRATSAHLSSMFTASSADSSSMVPRIATSAHLLGTSLGKAREGVAPLDTLAPMQELDEEQAVGGGIGVTTAGPALTLSRSTSISPVRAASGKPSGLSRLIAGNKSREGSANAERNDAARSPIDADNHLPGQPSTSPPDQSGTSAETIRAEDVQVQGERAGLLGAHVRPSYGAVVLPPSSSNQNNAPDALPPPSSSTPERRLTWKSCRTLAQNGVARAKELATPGAVKAGLALTAVTLPAVLLGMLLNVLDGVSYGMILFPAGEIFDNFAGLGVAMFFVTTFISQMVYTFGGSAFEGANGSMMIEVVPFFHMLTSGIIAHVGEEKPDVVVATTMVAFCLSITFLLLGVFRLGVIIGFFPRHILVGCIGGVGWFLIETGFEVAAGVNDEEGFQYNMATFRKFFMDTHNLSLWVPAFALAVLLRIITHRVHHQLVFPVYFIAIGIIFYIVVGIIGIDMDTLRNGGWVFDVGGSREPWYTFYTKFDFGKTSWSAIWAGIPTQLALLFFNTLHPPLNVPALAVSLNEDNIDTNRELTAHGISNLLAGFAGVAPNYLVYVNTLLFYRVGGGTRYAGFLLACSSVLLLWIGTAPIGYIPVMVVGALIFVLGIDLVKESVWDTRHRVSRQVWVRETARIIPTSPQIGIYHNCSHHALHVVVRFCDWSVVWDRTRIGTGFFFVIQNSRRQCIRALYYGDTAMSTVRRPSAHRQYIREVACQTAILRLQGMIFFGSVTYVESTIRQLIDIANWNKRPIRFLIVDLALVGGLDMSSAEAFVRVQRLLAVKRVTLIVCGVSADSAVGKALQQVDVWADRGTGVEVFETLNEAMEWTENAYLRAWFAANSARKEEPESETVARPAPRERSQRLPIAFGASYMNSPRRSHLVDAGQRLMANADDGSGTPAVVESSEPTPPREPTYSLIKTFSSHTNDPELMAKLAAYFARVELQAGQVLWRQGDSPDGIYVIESGVLQANYDFAAHSAPVQEVKFSTSIIHRLELMSGVHVKSMTAGTLAGELSALSGTPRNATVVAERPSVVWKMSAESFEKLEQEQGEVAKAFVTLVLKAAKQDYDVLLAALATRH